MRGNGQSQRVDGVYSPNPVQEPGLGRQLGRLAHEALQLGIGEPTVCLPLPHLGPTLLVHVVVDEQHCGYVLLCRVVAFPPHGVVILLFGGINPLLSGFGLVVRGEFSLGNIGDSSLH